MDPLLKTTQSVSSLCVICWESLGTENVCATHCGHLYHRPCLQKWFQRSLTCPHCRTKLNVSDIVQRIFFTVGETISRSKSTPSLLNETQSLICPQRSSSLESHNSNQFLGSHVTPTTDETETVASSRSSVSLYSLSSPNQSSFEIRDVLHISRNPLNDQRTPSLRTCKKNCCSVLSNERCSSVIPTSSENMTELLDCERPCPPHYQTTHLHTTTEHRNSTSLREQTLVLEKQPLVTERSTPPSFLDFWSSLYKSPSSSFLDLPLIAFRTRGNSPLCPMGSFLPASNAYNNSLSTLDSNSSLSRSLTNLNCSKEVPFENTNHSMSQTDSNSISHQRELDHSLSSKDINATYSSFQSSNLSLPKGSSQLVANQSEHKQLLRLLELSVIDSQRSLPSRQLSKDSLDEAIDEVDPKSLTITKTTNSVVKENKSTQDSVRSQKLSPKSTYPKENKNAVGKERCPPKTNEKQPPSKNTRSSSQIPKSQARVCKTTKNTDRPKNKLKFSLIHKEEISKTDAVSPKCIRVSSRQFLKKQVTKEICKRSCSSGLPTPVVKQSEKTTKGVSKPIVVNLKGLLEKHLSQTSMSILDEKQNMQFRFSNSPLSEFDDTVLQAEDKKILDNSLSIKRKKSELSAGFESPKMERKSSSGSPDRLSCYDHWSSSSSTEDLPSFFEYNCANVDLGPVLKERQLTPKPIVPEIKKSPRKKLRSPCSCSSSSSSLGTLSFIERWSDDQSDQSDDSPSFLDEWVSMSSPEEDDSFNNYANSCVSEKVDDDHESLEEEEEEEDDDEEIEHFYNPQLIDPQKAHRDLENKEPSSRWLPSWAVAILSTVLLILFFYLRIFPNL